MELFLESAIDGEFSGWREKARFPLANGDIWQQISTEYKFCYKSNPRVRIWKGKMLYFLEVQGIDGRVEIRRLFPEPI
jgi:hypothetical protein